MSLLSRLFPEALFPRKLAPAAERRLRLAQARAEESVIRAHVDNALMFVDTLAEDLPFDRAIDNQVSRLRKKIEVDAKNPDIIKTVWGGGYTLAAEVTRL